MNRVWRWTESAVRRRKMAPRRVGQMIFRCRHATPKSLRWRVKLVQPGLLHGDLAFRHKRPLRWGAKGHLKQQTERQDWTWFHCRPRRRIPLSDYTSSGQITATCFEGASPKRCDDTKLNNNSCKKNDGCSPIASEVYCLNNTPE
jgi:hypothetical protein